MSRTISIARLVAILLATPLGALRAENRSYDGTGNNVTYPGLGVANIALERIQYQPDYANPFSAIWTDQLRTNARTLSNALMDQSASIPNSRGLSNYAWGWGQFLDHDMDLTTTSNGAGTNGSYPIAVPNGDSLGPNPIAFTRSNFVIGGGVRQQVNEVTSFIDGSQVYGSDATRAAALRTSGGTGAKLQTSANNLLPYNTGGLANQNQGPTPASQLFLAGDIRANENLLLTSIQTVFVREHNRLVDLIAVQQPGLNAEDQYQLARKIVGAEIQAITYKEFLPAILGTAAPKVQDYSYQAGTIATITNSFAHSAFRFGHSMLTNDVKLANSAGIVTGTMSLGQISSNPSALTNNPDLLNQLLCGAAGQSAEEVDLKYADAIRTILFGPPGAGGTDLAAVDIMRGRDHGLPDYNKLRTSYDLPAITSFSQISSNTAVNNALQAAYNGDINNIDSLVGALAEDHLPGQSVGPLMSKIISDQFIRSRDGDRLFYRNNAAGLYANDVLNAQIASLVNLNTIKLSDIIALNTGLSGLPANLFFTQTFAAADFNHDGHVNALDLTLWRNSLGASAGGDADGDGDTDGADLVIWQRQFANAAAQANVGAVPEPAAAVLLAIAIACCVVVRRRRF